MTKHARCENCRWWDNSRQSGVIDGESGMCRATLPTIDKRDGTARWPFTEDVDWCGRFEEPLGPKVPTPEYVDAMKNVGSPVPISDEQEPSDG